MAGEEKGPMDTAKGEAVGSNLIKEVVEKTTGSSRRSEAGIKTKSASFFGGFF